MQPRLAYAAQLHTLKVKSFSNAGTSKQAHLRKAYCMTAEGHAASDAQLRDKHLIANSGFMSRLSCSTTFNISLT